MSSRYGRAFQSHEQSFWKTGAMKPAAFLPFFSKGLTASWIPSTITFALATVALLLFFWKRNADRIHERKVLPPGPSGLPVVGYLPFLGHRSYVTYQKLADCYGPIVRLKLGCRDVVVLNDLNSIKEGLNKDEILARPKDFLMTVIGMKGIVTMNGSTWLKTRRFSLHVLRNFGYGKKRIEERIKKEAAELVGILSKNNGMPSALGKTLVASVSRNITALLFGERYNMDHPRRHFLAQAAFQIARNASFVSPMDFLPTVRKLLFCIPCSRHWNICKRMGKILNFFREEVEDHLTSREDSARDFIDSYLTKIRDNGGESSSYSMEYLVGNAVNLFGAGSNTVRTVLEWHLLNCARDPDGVQYRIQREIDVVIGRDRSPEWEDRLKMPFTMAAIWEMLRWRTVAPLGIPRAAERDTKIAGYDISAGTVLLSNIWAVHNDPTVWKNPSEFNPSRFLNEDGTELLPRPEALIPFSTGRRMCPGETLAMVEIFLYLTTLLQTFTVYPKKGHTISMDVYDGLISVPVLDQELVLLVR